MIKDVPTEKKNKRRCRTNTFLATLGIQNVKKKIILLI